MQKEQKLEVAENYFDRATFKEFKELFEANETGKIKAVKRPRFQELSFQLSQEMKKHSAHIQNSSQVTTAKPLYLDDGMEVKWTLEIIKAEEVEKQTFVIEANNGRPQSLLTEVNLSLLTHSFRKNKQFYPAYGCRHPDGKVEIIDGSRRRMSAIFSTSDLEVWVTEYQLTPQQKKSLRLKLQSAKEPSIYDVGLECIALEEEGMNGVQIAEALNISQSKVTRAKQAAKAPIEFLKLYDDYSVLSLADLKQLSSLHEQLKKSKGESVLSNDSPHFKKIESAISKLGVIDDSEEQAKVVNKKIKLACMNIITGERVRKDLSKTPTKNLLAEKNTSQRITLKKKTSKDGSETDVYELNRMSKESRHKFLELVESFIEENY